MGGVEGSVDGWDVPGEDRTGGMMSDAGSGMDNGGWDGVDLEALEYGTSEGGSVARQWPWDGPR